jgi:hypothetical protein
MKYYYIRGIMGLTSSGSFSREKSRWIIFTEDEYQRFNNADTRPYGTTKKGIFINTDKF